MFLTEFRTRQDLKEKEWLAGVKEFWAKMKSIPPKPVTKTAKMDKKGTPAKSNNMGSLQEVPEGEEETEERVAQEGQIQQNQVQGETEEQGVQGKTEEQGVQGEQGEQDVAKDFEKVGETTTL